MTEVRIKSLEKINMLRSEITRIKNRTSCHPDRDFNKLLYLSAESQEDDSCEEDSEPEAADQFPYTEGEMVTVNCGSKATPLTPFWVGKITSISTRTSGLVDIGVHWYERSPRQTGPLYELCYTGSYRSMRSGNVGKIPVSSIIVDFDCTDSNRLPIQAQK